MTNLTKRRIACALLSLSVAASAYAKSPEPEAEDGVKVGKMSRLRNLVPEQQLEAQSLQQYIDLKSQAQAHGALAPEDDPRVQRLHAIAAKLIPHTQRWNPRAAQWKWEVVMIGSKQVNAFCMPGGKIAFFSGIIDGLKLTDDEIAIVMGHEMAHALREHGRDRIAKGTALRLGAAVASSLFKLKQTGQAVVGQGAQLALLKFSRGDETEADLVGLDIAARAGYDPRAGVVLWKKMGMLNKNGPPQWLSTHPAGANRIQEIERHLPEAMPLYARSKGATLASLPPYQSNVRGIAPVNY